MQIIPFRTCVKKEENIWFSSDTFNGIFKLNMNDSKIEFISKYPNEPLFGSSLYCHSVLWQNEIVYIPFCANEIATLDTNTNVISKFKLPDQDMKSKWKFSSACVYKDDIYMIPGKFPYIIVFDMKNHEIKKKITWKADLPEKYREENRQLAANTIGVIGKLAYIQLIYTNILIVLNLEKGEIERTIVLPEGKYTVATVYEDDIWVLPQSEGKIIKVSLKNYEIETVCEMPLKVVNDAGYASSRVIGQNGKLYLFPQGADKIGIVDIKNKRCETEDTIMKSLFQEKGEYPRFLFTMLVDEKKILAILYYKEKDVYDGIIFELEDMKVSAFDMDEPCKWRDICETKYIGEYDTKQMSLGERQLSRLTKNHPLEAYLKYVSKEQTNSINVINSKELGELIYEEVNGELC